MEPRSQLRLLAEFDDPFVFDLQFAEPSRRLHRRHRGDLAVRMVERYQFVHIDVGNSVAVGEEERVAVDVFLDAFDAAAGHGVEASLGQGDAPGFGAGTVDREGVRLAELHCQIGPGEVIVQEIAFDAPALIAQAKDEIGEAVFGIALHDVPEDWPAADGDHRAWAHRRPHRGYVSPGRRTRSQPALRAPPNSSAFQATLLATTALTPR